MADQEDELTALYDWVQRILLELAEFPLPSGQNLIVDRSRVVMALTCFKVSLELRVLCRFPQRRPYRIGPVEPPPPRRSFPGLD